jgi:two-component system chemotaxis sensor kinase CheA
MLYLLGRGTGRDIGREDIEDVFIFVIDDMELAIAPLDTPDEAAPVEDDVEDGPSLPLPHRRGARPSPGPVRKACAFRPNGWTN